MRSYILVDWDICRASKLERSGIWRVEIQSTMIPASTRKSETALMMTAFQCRFRKRGLCLIKRPARLFPRRIWR